MHTNNNWQFHEVKQLFELPFLELLYRAHQVHRQHFDPNDIQISSLLSIKTGGCPEDCAYCPQSAHFSTGVTKIPLMSIEEVREKAMEAKENGATRFCMAAAWKSPPKKSFEILKQMIEEVKKLDLETCMTLGMLSNVEAEFLKNAGLDYYNHNLDTSRQFYEKIITTRTYDERLETLKNVRESGIKVCCGGIMGMGETEEDRIQFLLELAHLSEPPESVPINQLVKIPGTPLEAAEDLDPFDFVRTIAVARILLPRSYIRLSAGRKTMSDELQALCFFGGANSIHYGKKLCTTMNFPVDEDQALFKKLGLQFKK